MEISLLLSVCYAFISVRHFPLGVSRKTLDKRGLGGGIMIRAVWLVLLAFGVEAHASNAYRFEGTWKGSGHYASGAADTDVSTEAVLTITLDATSFRFEECWDYRDKDWNPRHSCIMSTYDLENDSLFHDGRKVGDIFPDKVLIFEGSPQVGEQIVMEQTHAGELHYRYTYSNFDGALERREATLTLSAY